MFWPIFLPFYVLSTTAQSLLGSTGLIQVTWASTLRTQEDLNEYLEGMDRMVEEKVSLDANNEFVLIGPNPTGKLNLSHVLNTLIKKRKDHGLVLEMSNEEVYEKSLELFKKISNGNWITLMFPISHGPCGSDQIYPVEALNKVFAADKWPKGIRVGLTQTVGYDCGSVSGYTLSHFQELMERVLKLGNLESYKVDIHVDVYHLSKTNTSDSFPIPENLGRVIFYAAPHMEKKVNVELFMGFYSRIGPERSYMNMSPELKKKIIDFDLGEESRAIGRRIDWRMSIVACLLVTWKCISTV